MKVILVCVLISAIQNYWISRPNMARTLIVTPTHTRGSWKSRRTEIKVVMLSNFNFIARDWWKVDKIYSFRLSKPLGLKYHFENLQFAEQCFWEPNAIYKWGCNPGHVWCGFHIWSKTYKIQHVTQSAIEQNLVLQFRLVHLYQLLYLTRYLGNTNMLLISLIYSGVA